MLRRCARTWANARSRVRMILLSFVEARHRDDKRLRRTLDCLTRFLAQHFDVDDVRQFDQIHPAGREQRLSFAQHVGRQHRDRCITGILPRATREVARTLLAQSRGETEVTHTDPRHVAGAGKVPQREIEVADDILVPRNPPKTQGGERPDQPVGQHLVQQLQMAAQFALPALLVQRMHPLRGRQHVNGHVVGNRIGAPEQQFVRRIRHAEARREELPV